MRPENSPKIILVADDDPFIQALLVRLLSNKECACVCANHGQEAVELFKKVHPDLALLDADMPEMDGFQTCAAIKKLPEWCDTPIIMVTGSADRSSVDRAFSVGFEEYITKPIHMAVLQHRVRRILERTTMEKALRLANEEMEDRILKRTQELQQTIVAREISEARLKISETKFRSLVEESPDTIMILGREGQVLFTNRPIVFFQQVKVPYYHVFDYLPPQAGSRCKQAINKVFSSGEDDAFLMEGESSTWWQIRIIPLLYQEQKTVDSVMVIATEVTERYNLQSKAMQNARLATVGTLAAGVAHEVNNPNNAILLQAEWLQDAWRGFQECLETREEKWSDCLIGGRSFVDALYTFPKFIARIIENAHRVGAITENLKQMSRPNNGNLKETIQLKTVLQAARSLLANPIQKYTDSCSFHISDTIPAIQGNAQQLEQVFINLLLNALQALRHRKEKICVQLYYDAQDKNVVVQIEDEGVGIPEENMGNIKNPFFTTKLEQGGTGLGLSISQSIINDHNGKMDIVSEQGKGTTVRVKFPIIAQTVEKCP